MTTAQRVFDLAMGLMDEVNETSGLTDTADTKEYKNRTLLIISALRNELYPYSDTLTQKGGGKRPVCAAVTDFTSPLDLDDVLAQTVLPYGLAAQLLLDENPVAASFLQHRYTELTASLAVGIPVCSEDITGLYGGTEHRGFGRW